MSGRSKDHTLKGGTSPYSIACVWEYSPGCNFIPNNNSALHEDEFVRRAIKELLTTDLTTFQH